MELIAYILICITVVFIISSWLYSKNGICKKFYHDILGWHMPDTSGKYKCTFDGLNLKTICKYCGKEIMQDSQGNWF